jgi:O-antigen/teichoic acid export membrane protein
MFLIVVVSLYTVRIVLQALGDVDYGIYNVVAGVVAMFQLLNSVLKSASIRFFSIEIGKGNNIALNEYFNTSAVIYIFFSIIVLMLAETVGLWFVNNKLLIPADRLNAANLAYQFAVISLIFTLLTVSYEAIVIAYEKMNIFAILSIFDTITKLLLVYLLNVFSADKLVLYSILMCIIPLLSFIIYALYVHSKFKEIKFKVSLNKKRIIEVVSFSGWNSYSAVSLFMRLQGINILSNLFFGPVVNAARGIAYRIGVTLNGFVLNLQTATKAKITQYYANNNFEQMKWLVYSNSRFSFFALFIVALPLIFEIETILKLWLKDVPAYTVTFTILVLIDALVEAPSQSLETAALATGRLKKYQIVTKTVELCNLPISFLLLKFFYTTPYLPMFVSISLFVVSLFVKIFVLSEIVPLFRLKDFCRDVILRISIVAVVSLCVPLLIKSFADASVCRIFISVPINVLWTATAIYFLGLAKQEKQFISHFVVRKIKGL